VAFTFETDKAGNNQWSELTRITVPANSSEYIEFTAAQKAEWIRVKTDKTTPASVGFVYTSSEKRTTKPDPVFKGIASVGSTNSMKGLLYSLGNNRRALGLLASNKDGEVGYYEIDQSMKFTFKPTDTTANFIRRRLAIPHQVVTIEKSSVLIVDNAGRRWKLPLGNENIQKLPITTNYVFAVKWQQSGICSTVTEHFTNCLPKMPTVMRKYVPLHRIIWRYMTTLRIEAYLSFQESIRQKAQTTRIFLLRMIRKLPYGREP